MECNAEHCAGWWHLLSSFLPKYYYKILIKENYSLLELWPTDLLLCGAMAHILNEVKVWGGGCDYDQEGLPKLYEMTMR